jgi:hypothetical protein
MPFQRLYPVLLHLADMRILRIHEIDGIYSEETDLEIFFRYIAVCCLKIYI